MTPHEMAKYRRATNDPQRYNWKSRTCACCKKSRSTRQFEGNSKVCNRCKGK